MVYSRLSCVILASLFATGCVGSAVLRDVDTDAPFPKLHSVPERPPAENIEELQQSIDESLQFNEKMLEENRRLRQQYKMPEE